MSAYSVPAGEARFAHEIKKSRFVGIAVPASSPETAAARLAEVRGEFPDATHHSWAYVIGDPKASSNMRMDDDGEPSGTAGKPILRVLQHGEVGDVLVVVVRYFGGVKLGAGGLVRAYASTASKVLERLDVVPKIAERRAHLELDYAEERPIRRLLHELGVGVSASSYGARVELTIRFPEERSREIADALAEQSGGRVKLHAI